MLAHDLAAFSTIHPATRAHPERPGLILFLRRKGATLAEMLATKATQGESETTTTENGEIEATVQATATTATIGAIATSGIPITSSATTPTTAFLRLGIFMLTSQPTSASAGSALPSEAETSTPAAAKAIATGQSTMLAGAEALAAGTTIPAGTEDLATMAGAMMAGATAITGADVTETNWIDPLMTSSKASSEAASGRLVR